MALDTVSTRSLSVLDTRQGSKHVTCGDVVPLSRDQRADVLHVLGTSDMTHAAGSSCLDPKVRMRTRRAYRLLISSDRGRHRWPAAMLVESDIFSISLVVPTLLISILVLVSIKARESPQEPSARLPVGESNSDLPRSLGTSEYTGLVIRTGRPVKRLGRHFARAPEIAQKDRGHAKRKN